MIELPGLKKRYKIISVFSEREGGITYYGRIEPKREPIIIKKILLAPSHPPLDELRALLEKLSRMLGPNLLKMIDYSLTEEELIIIREFTFGINLRKVLREKFSLKVIAYIIQSVLRTLKYLAQYHIFYCTLKLENIFISEDGLLKFSDFGINPLQWFKETLWKDLPSFSPSEHYSKGGGEEYLDFYALGILLWQMLTGQTQPKGKLEETNLPSEARRIIKKCLTLRSRERYSSLYILEEELREFWQINKIELERGEVISFLKNLTEIERKPGERKKSWKILFRKEKKFLGISAICFFLGIGMIKFSAKIYYEKTKQKLIISSPVVHFQRKPSIKIKEAKGILKLSLIPEEASIYINGERVVPEEGLISLPAGEYELEVKKEGYQRYHRKVTLKEGQEVSLPIQLTPVRGSGKLSLEVIPWAKVYINGKYYETTPLEKPITLRAGKHTLILRNPHWGEKRLEVLIKKGEFKKLKVSFEE
jgi:serine/threonine protein kinase